MGNIRYYKVGHKVLNYTYNGNQQLMAVSGYQTRAFQYDDKGNVINNGYHTFNYNSAGQMVASDVGVYVYNGHNKRVKTVDTEGTRYSFYASNGQLVYRKVNGVHSDYYYLGKKLVARKKGTGVSYIHSDHLGSPAAETNSSGLVTTRMHYEPFGEPIEAPKDEIGYTGHKFDKALDLSYMQARYYDPAIGRFYGNDPIGYRDVYSFNRFAYANNNPYKYVDPDGRATCAASDCKTAYIDHEIKAGAPALDSSLNGNPDARVVSVTFENDVAGGASTDLPVTTETAIMVESAVKNSGADHVNINSSTGGHQFPSRHAQKKAVDINRINNTRVSDPSNSGNVANLQKAFSETPNIRENFGPTSQTKTNISGTTVNKPAMAATHKDHVHASGQN